MVDGREASSYKHGDLRKSTALLSQDHTLFPLSILENVGLGDPAASFDEDNIRRAAEKGGASRFVEKLEHKYDTILKPVSTKGRMGLTLKHPLIKRYEALEAKADVSGLPNGFLLCGLQMLMPFLLRWRAAASSGVSLQRAVQCYFCD